MKSNGKREVTLPPIVRPVAGTVARRAGLAESACRNEMQIADASPMKVLNRERPRMIDETSNPKSCCVTRIEGQRVVEANGPNVNASGIGTGRERLRDVEVEIEIEIGTEGGIANTTSETKLKIESESGRTDSADAAPTRTVRRNFLERMRKGLVIGVTGLEAMSGLAPLGSVTKGDPTATLGRVIETTAIEIGIATALGIPSAHRRWLRRRLLRTVRAIVYVGTGSANALQYEIPGARRTNRQTPFEPQIRLTGIEEIGVLVGMKPLVALPVKRNRPFRRPKDEILGLCRMF